MKESDLNELKFFRLFGIVLGLIVIPTTFVYLYFNVGSNSLLWVFLGLFALSISVFSYFSDYVKKNISYTFIVWIYVGISIAVFDVYYDNFKEFDLFIVPTGVFLSSVFSFKQKRLYIGFLFYTILLSVVAIVIATLTKGTPYVNTSIYFAFTLISLASAYSTFLSNNKYKVAYKGKEDFPEKNPNPVIEIDRKGKIVYMNPSARSEFPEIEKEGSKHHLFEKIDLSAIEAEDMSILANIRIGEKVYTQKIVPFEETDTIRIFLSDVTNTITYGKELEEAKTRLDKQRLALMNLLEDVAEEKDLATNRSQVLLETLGEAVIVTDDEGRINYSNPAFKTLLGYGNEIYNKDIADIFTAYDLSGKELAPLYMSNSAALTAEGEELRIMLETKGKEKVSVLMNSAPIKLKNEFKGVIRIIRNISEEVKLQQQKDDFFSIASHELRTPLTVISGNLDIILQGYGNSKLSKDDQILMKDTLTASDRLIKMVNDFLNVSRIDQGRLQYIMENLDPCKVTKEVLKELQPLAENKGLKLIYSCDKKHKNILADEGLLKEIIINLVGNALKFTEKGGVTIKNSVENEWAVVRVVDTGIGIEKDKQRALFQRFQQAMSRTLSRQAGGTGLGLYISRQFAQKMGGDLILERSEYKKGSIFKLTLPLAKK